jgi:hypothetical protein
MVKKKQKKKKQGRGRGRTEGSTGVSAQRGMTRNIKGASFAHFINRKNRRAVTRYYLSSACWILSRRLLNESRRSWKDSSSDQECVSRAGDFPNSPSPSTDVVNEMARDYPSRGLEIIETLLTIRLCARPSGSRAGWHSSLVLLDSASRIATAQIDSWL